MESGGPAVAWSQEVQRWHWLELRKRPGRKVTRLRETRRRWQELGELYQILHGVRGEGEATAGPFFRKTIHQDAKSRKRILRAPGGSHRNHLTDRGGAGLQRLRECKERVKNHGFDKIGRDKSRRETP